MAFDWRSNALSCSEARQKTTQRTATANFRGFRNAHLGVESRREWDFSMEVSSKFPHEETAEGSRKRKAGQNVRPRTYQYSTFLLQCYKSFNQARLCIERLQRFSNDCANAFHPISTAHSNSCHRA